MTLAAPAHPTLLVVEDDDVSREGIAVVLRGAGYRVVPAADGAEALRLLRSEPPDLILLDMLMPVLDGWHFLDRMRQEPSQPPIIVTTATSVLGREWAEAHGCAGFVRKPVEAEELLEEVRRCLA